MFLQKDALALVKFFANLRAAGTQEKFFLSELVNFIYQQLLANVEIASIIAKKYNFKTEYAFYKKRY